jgi:uncharacterized protein (TIGR00730 family)
MPTQTKNDPLQTLTEDQFNLLKIIQEEYKMGMLTLNSVGKHTLTIYGGSRVKPNDLSYKGIEEVSRQLAHKGWGVISGGGPGIMTAALDGAKKGNGKAYAFCINIEGEPPASHPDLRIIFSQFSVRKYLLRQSDAFIFAPGGLGTLDELMELLTLIKTNKYPHKPIFLFDSKFWEGYMNWFRDMLFIERGVVGEDFFDLFQLVNTPEEIIDYLYSENL